MNYLEDSSDNTEFTFRVERDVKKYLTLSRFCGERNFVLLFPPLNNVRRFQIHTVIQEKFSDYELRTLSVGKLNCRRTAVFIGCNVPKEIRSPVKVMTAVEDKTKDSCGVKNKQRLPSIQLYRPPAARTATCSNVPPPPLRSKPNKTNRIRKPDLQVYVPLPKRILLQKEETCGLKDVATVDEGLNEPGILSHETTAADSKHENNDDNTDSVKFEESSVIDEPKDITVDSNIDFINESDTYEISCRKCDTENSESVDKTNDFSKSVEDNDADASIVSQNSPSNRSSIAEFENGEKISIDRISPSDDDAERSSFSNAETCPSHLSLSISQERDRTMDNNDMEVDQLSAIENKSKYNDNSDAEERNESDRYADVVYNNSSESFSFLEIENSQITIANDDETEQSSVISGNTTERISDNSFPENEVKDGHSHCNGSNNRRHLTTEFQTETNENTELDISSIESSATIQIEPANEQCDQLSDGNLNDGRPKSVDECKNNDGKVSISNSDWDELFDENGEYINEDVMNEILSVIGDASVKRAPSNYREFQTLEERSSDGESIVEIYGFPAEFRTSDLVTIFSDFKDDGFQLSWVDDTHALGIFSSPFVADRVLNAELSFAKTRPLREAISKSKLKAKNFILPPATRPQTCAVLARRLVSGALGMKISVTPDRRQAENKMLSEAREKRKQVTKQRNEMWGTSTDTSRDQRYATGSGN